MHDKTTKKVNNLRSVQNKGLKSKHLEQISEPCSSLIRVRMYPPSMTRYPVQFWRWCCYLGIGVWRIIVWECLFLGHYALAAIAAVCSAHPWTNCLPERRHTRDVTVSIHARFCSRADEGLPALGLLVWTELTFKQNSTACHWIAYPVKVAYCLKAD